MTITTRSLFAWLLAGLFPLLQSQWAWAEAIPLLATAEGQIQSGRLQDALQTLGQARREAEASLDFASQAAIAGALGSVWLRLGNLAEARAALDDSLSIARATNQHDVEARTLLNRGNLVRASGDTAAALSDYNAAIRIAETAGDTRLVARARINAGRVQLERDEFGAAVRDLDAAQKALAEDPALEQVAFERLALGRLRLELSHHLPDQRMLSFATLDSVRQLASTSGDHRTEAWALLYLGELYRDDGRSNEALVFWRRGAFQAQQVSASDILWRLDRAIGRTLKASGDNKGAIRAYEGAISALAAIRLDLPTFDPVTGRSLFREVVGPVFLELAELLLDEARHEPDGGQHFLVEARRQIETLKAVELADYFRDDCVADLQARVKSVDMATGAATLYPIILPNRLELLLSLPGGRIEQRSQIISTGDLDEVVHRFRAQLEDRTTRRYLLAARKLYDIIIRPFADDLTTVDTLVIVPDGVLRTIPFAALNDGSQFLVERIAVATAPGLELLDLRPVGQVRLNVLVGGLSKPVQGFAALPFVEAEVTAIHNEYGGVVLLDDAFISSTVQSSLERVPFTVVHIASHGEFKGDPKQSFVLTYDGKLDMDGLERLVKQSRFRDEPVELLTLSACRTAAGDDRAALGLAGVAVKAGARSALASLWFINDQSSSQLVETFYRSLVEPGSSKARALRTAQLSLLADPRYEHPAYWAPFLLIGNWL